MANILDSCKDKFVVMVREFGRRYYLNKLTGKIGEIEICDDKIVCYVKQDLLDKTLRGKYSIYDLELYGVSKNIEDKEMLEWYGLDKPLFYVFDNIKFRAGLKFSSFHASVIFKNCQFRENIGIFWAEDVIFENNKYYNWTTRFYLGDSFLYGRVYGNLKFVDDNFVNSYEYKKYGDNKFGMSIEVGNLEIVNSKIEAESLGNIQIEAQEMNIIDSEIVSSEVYVDSKVMKSVNGNIIASRGVIIDNENKDLGICNIDAPYFVYNGNVLVSGSTNSVVIDTRPNDLEKNRLRLLEELKKVRDCCNVENDKVIQVLKNDLNSRQVGKVLSKVKK